MQEAERQSKLMSLAECKRQGEKAYDDMYEAHSPRDANDCYRNAKDYFDDAIALAGELGLSEEKEALLHRLLHIKAVFRSQFSQ